MSDGRRLARRDDFSLLALGAVSAAILALLADRVVRAGTFLNDAFLKKCLAKCAGLMSLAVSTLDGLDILAVAALTVVFAAAAGRCLAAARQARKFRRSLTRLETPPRLGRVLAGTGLSSGRVVVFSGRPGFACTIGLFRPRVFLSHGLVESLSDAELLAVLRHEHGHLLRRDPLRGLLALFFGQFFFFISPLKRHLAGLKRNAELLADRHALALATAPLDLASALVKTSGRNLGAGMALSRFGEPDLLGERLSRLLNIDLDAKASARVFRVSPARAFAGLLLASSLWLLLVPAGAGFAGASPWHCPHTDHAACCSAASSQAPCSHCRT